MKNKSRIGKVLRNGCCFTWEFEDYHIPVDNFALNDLYRNDNNSIDNRNCRCLVIPIREKKTKTLRFSNE